MNEIEINKIIAKFSHERLSASPAEHEFAEYIEVKCKEMGLSTKRENFGIETYRVKHESLYINGRAVFCKSYYGSGSGRVSAPVFYMPNIEDVSLSKCEGKIVLLDDRIVVETYRRIVSAGAVGLLIRGGGIQLKSGFLRRGELRFGRPIEKLIPCAVIGTEDFISIVKEKDAFAEMSVEMTKHNGKSPNVIADIQGESDEQIVLAAHIDSTEQSLGTYDNMSGCISLLMMAEYFRDRKPKRSLRFLWCGSEERGLLGSIAYCRRHKSDNKHAVLNVTLDMIGALTGPFVSYACANRESEELLRSFALEHAHATDVRYMLRSTDVKPFVAAGVPAVSFSRYANTNVAPIHTEYDTPDAVSVENIISDTEYIASFVEHVANAEVFPIPRKIDKGLKKEAKDYVNKDKEEKTKKDK